MDDSNLLSIKEGKEISKNLGKRLSVINDEQHTTTIQIRNLNIELTCPVCLGILRDTMTVMECLHRFCNDCINKCLRLGKKECPTCRVKCTSRRHLRPDPNFDAIISSIYPNLDEYEAKEENIIKEINKEIIENGFLIKSVEQGKLRQALAKKQKNKKKKEFIDEEKINIIPKRNTKLSKEENNNNHSLMEQEKESSLCNSNTKLSLEQKQNKEEISFVLVLHPNEKILTQLPNKYLRTSKLLTIKHLGSFLSKKFPQYPPSSFKFYININATSSLEDSFTLEFIDKVWWCGQQNQDIYYKLNNSFY